MFCGSCVSFLVPLLNISIIASLQFILLVLHLSTLAFRCLCMSRFESSYLLNVSFLNFFRFLLSYILLIQMLSFLLFHFLILRSNTCIVSSLQFRQLVVHLLQLGFHLLLVLNLDLCSFRYLCLQQIFHFLLHFVCLLEVSLFHILHFLFLFCYCSIVACS